MISISLFSLAFPFFSINLSFSFLYPIFDLSLQHFTLFSGVAKESVNGIVFESIFCPLQSRKTLVINRDWLSFELSIVLQNLPLKMLRLVIFLNLLLFCNLSFSILQVLELAKTSHKEFQVDFLLVIRIKGHCLKCWKIMKRPSGRARGGNPKF